MPFERKYTDQQRRAIEDASLERGISYSRIVKLAREGKLIKGEPFEINENYVGFLIRRAKRIRVGTLDSPLAKIPHRDALEVLRVRIINVLELELREFEHGKPGKRDLAKAHQLIRLLIEANRVPGPNEARPLPADGRNAKTGERGVRAPSMAGPLLRAHRGTVEGPDDAGPSVNGESGP